MARIRSDLVNQQLASLSTMTGVAAPIGGWNTRDSLSAMPNIDAVELDNWFPTSGSVVSRNGFESFSTGFPSAPETIVEYNSGVLQEMVAASGSKLYTVDDAGAKTEIGTGLSNARWQTANFNSFLLLVNGADTPRSWNGTILSTLTITLKDGGGTPIVGTTSADMEGINIFKNRVYMWSTSEQRFFVGGVNAIQGDFTEFPLSRISQLGGSLLAMGTITRDGGSGADDLACFIMSTGEVIIYNGDNPTDANSWALEGRYRIPRPVSVRGVCQYKGDLKVITENDFTSVLEVIAQGGIDVNPSKLTGAVSTAFRTYSSNYGWQALTYTRGDMLIMNVPISTNSTYNQYITNTVTGAACKFSGLNGSTFGIYKGDLYFGNSTSIFKADTGSNDNGADINLSGQTAFTTFNTPNRKRFISLRHVIKSSAAINMDVSVAVDYGNTQQSLISSSVSSGTQWDTAQWDTFQWAAEETAQNITTSLSSNGVAFSNKINISLSGDSAEWFRTDYNVDIMQGF